MTSTHSFNTMRIAGLPLRGFWTKRALFGIALVLLLAGGVAFFTMNPAPNATPVPDFATTSAAPPVRFFIAPCSTPITGGKASLVIGALQGNSETYVGNYDLKVFPYFFMNETGSLSMTLPNESVRKLDQGTAVAATGQALTKKNGKTRKVTATLTPTTKDTGSVTFAFTGEDTKLTFKSTYRRESK